ncbi:MAG: DsbA family protein [Rhodobacteraceae bacterium]|nr:DsbA family protein [Paracoccaceae bacterium]
MIRIRMVAPLTLALGLVTAPVAGLDLDQMSPAEQAAFGAQIREYLLQNPEVIVQAITILEERQSRQQAQADLQLVANNAQAIFNDGFSWVGGNPDGDITLVEFMDYRCGFCRRSVPEIAQLLESDGNIRWVIKEFPILGEDSLASSRFAIAVKRVEGPDAYKQAHDALVELTASVSDATLRRLSDGLGFDTSAVLAEMDSEAVTREILQTRALAQRLNISGTPTFVLEDEVLRGFLPADQMQAIVDDKRS